MYSVLNIDFLYIAYPVTPTYVVIDVEEGCTNQGRQEARATKFYTLAPNIG
jgi:hypothetical protein